MVLTADELNVIRGRLHRQGYIGRPDALLLLEQAERMRVFADVELSRVTRVSTYSWDDDAGIGWAR